jgi:SAM-dependent methyltransferase
MPWTHPTGKSPKIVTLVCLGPSRNSYIGARFEPDLSDCLAGVDEVWTLNRGHSTFAHDLCFVMDHLGGEADKFPRYGASLWHHDKPIITSDNFDGWPGHVHPFPFKEVWNWLIGAVNPMHGDWYHNSLAYILIYAGFIGVKDLRIFGADYAQHSSGLVEDGHPCVAYWVGKMEAAGLKVMTTPDSAFLGANQRAWIYGYQSDPRSAPANRARFRTLVGLPVDPVSETLFSGERQVGPTLEHIQPDHLARYQWAASRLSGVVLDLGSGVGYGTAILADAPAVVAVHGFEHSRESVDYARQHYARSNADWKVVELDFPYSFPPSDAATAFEIIEHLAHPDQLLRTLPAQKLLASVPNELVMPYSPETAPFHQRHYTPNEFSLLLLQSGWIVDHWHGQIDRTSPVVPFHPQCRTIIVEAHRCPAFASSNMNPEAGASPS